ncbi:hypothetical protein V5799_014922 [Amblyomma americanum]|uniref:BZIP domain-containing protein n=1 Tax=Amblyomma americanum TaxID=6943 RepID=A0AAQ4E1M5_AMBAM
MSNDKAIHVEDEPSRNDTAPTNAGAQGGDQVVAEALAGADSDRRSKTGEGGQAYAGDPFAICHALGLTRSDLVDMSVRQLNSRMRSAGLNGQDTRAIKHLRRMLKNRGYAAICRTRRVVQRGHLEEQKEVLHERIEALKAENAELAAEVARIQRDYTGLLAWCIEHHALTAEQIQPYLSSPLGSK